MNHWNHRVIRKVYENGEEEYSIREVHYNNAGKIYAYTEEAVDLARETLDGLRQYILWCLKALDDPILEDGKIEFASDDISYKDLEEAREYENIENLLNNLGK